LTAVTIREITMLRNALVLVVALALGASQAVRADRIIEQLESSFELLLANTALPVGGVGDVSFKTCDKCNSQSRLLTASTRFFLNGRELPAADFVAAAADVRKQESREPRSLLGLYVDKQTLHVNRVVLIQPVR
jgi:hypothetical protein